ncbi:MAG: type II toxin-antitoxin system RelE/ParE family toxin [Candidatus Methanoperedens sp.]|nr:type II toxin-antitoxin system RelE/ParE family toxin [Candidatus Methanoperedens sp.]
MPYELELTETLEQKLKKLQKKNKVLLIACRKKISEIINNPYHYKHLRYEDRFRVHVGGSFVLTYRIFEDNKLVLFLDIEHHDKAYL